MIEVRGLVKSFGAREALAGVDLDVADGESVTLVGPNGAGKTTLLRILATLVRPSAGSVTLDGVDLLRAESGMRRSLGFLSHHSLLYVDLTAEQNLRFYARLYNVADPRARIEELLAQVGLSDRAADPVRTFSRGMEQRLALARALLHRPRVLLLDEPYAGLDQRATETFDALLRGLIGEGSTMLLATHDLAHGVGMGERVVVLNQGRVVLDARNAEMDLQGFGQRYRRLVA